MYRFAQLLATIVITSGCVVHEHSLVYQGTEIDPTVPKPSELQLKVEQLHSAWQTRSYRQWYLLATHELRSSTDYYEFAESIEARKLTPTFWRIYSITAWPNSTAVVTMTLRLQDEFGTERSYYNITDYWAYIDGDWYWSSRNWRLD